MQRASTNHQGIEPTTTSPLDWRCNGNRDVNQLRRPAGSRSEHIMFAIVSLPILVTCRSREGIPSPSCLGLPRLSALPKFHSPDEPSNSPPPAGRSRSLHLRCGAHPRCGIKLVAVPLHFIPISRPTYLVHCRPNFAATNVEPHPAVVDHNIIITGCRRLTIFFQRPHCHGCDYLKR